MTGGNDSVTCDFMLIGRPVILRLKAQSYQYMAVIIVIIVMIIIFALGSIDFES